MNVLHKDDGMTRTAPDGTPCIFVTGIWKSGNHLVYSALNELGIEGPFNGISAHLLFGKHQWLKRILRRPRGQADAVQVGLETDALVSGKYIAGSAEKLAGKIMGGHAAHTPELEGVLRAAGARMICIRRDPRDILVSFADWIGSRPDFYMHKDFAGLSRDDRIARLLRGGPGTGYTLYPFTTVLDRAYGWRTAPDVLQVSFEELIGAQGGGDAAAQQGMVDALHAHTRPVKPLSEVKLENIYGGTLTFNKGRSKRSKELDNAELVAEINETLAPHLARWGYED